VETIGVDGLPAHTVFGPFNAIAPSFKGVVGDTIVNVNAPLPVPLLFLYLASTVEEASSVPIQTLVC